MTKFRLVCAAAMILPVAACASTPPTPALRGHIQMDMTEAEPSSTSGVLAVGDVIAVHTLRARHAVVLEGPVDGPVRDLEAGTALAAAVIDHARSQLDLPEAPNQVLWCDVRAGARLGFGYSDCFMDSDGDGRLDRGYIGENRGGDSQFGLTLFREPPAITGESLVDVAIRAAQPDEYPQTQIGFRFCSGDNRDGPLRFALVDAVRDGWSTPTRGCGYGVWPDAQPGPQIALADTMTLTISPEPEGFGYTLDGRFETGPLGDALDGRRPQPISAMPEDSATAAVNRLQALMESPVVGLADVTVQTGEVGRDEAFASQPVRHRHTGVLLNRVRPLGLFQQGSEPLAVGTPVYGMPLFGPQTLSAAFSGSDDSHLTWCAPRSSGEGEERAFWAICLPRAPQGYYWVRSSRGLYVTGLSISDSSSVAEAPSVQRQEIDFGVPITRFIQFREWDANDADIHIVIEAGPERYLVRDVSVPRAEDGSIAMNAFGQWVRLTQPDPRDRRRALVELTDPPETEPADPDAPPNPDAPAEMPASGAPDPAR
jgi:hypothetical protein